jgi:NTP pyrophosphatase (non-canonical NTP hydrolase)
MKEYEYAAFVQRLMVNKNTGTDGLMHAAIGIAGEAGELADAIKKVWVYNQPINFKNIVEELGDLEWYMQALRNMLGIERQDTIDANVAKLNKRYADGYSDEAAQKRADKTVVCILQSYRDPLTDHVHVVLRDDAGNKYTATVDREVMSKVDTNMQRPTARYALDWFADVKPVVKEAA